MPDDISYDDIINKDIFALLGTADMPEEKKKELYLKMIDIIQTRALNQIANTLSDDDVKKWKEVATTKDKQKEDEFLKSKNIDLSQIMLNQTLLYKAELIELMKQKGQNG